MFDGEHIFEIEQKAANRAFFVQREIYHGLLVPLFAYALEKDTRRDFEEMNRTLKQRAETRAG